MLSYSEKINNPRWQSFIENLNNYIDQSAKSNFIEVIVEFIKIENYLTNEAYLNKLEMFLSSKQEIIKNIDLVGVNSLFIFFLFNFIILI